MRNLLERLPPVRGPGPSVSRRRPGRAPLFITAGFAAATVGVLALSGCAADSAPSTGKPDTLRILYTTAEANAQALQAQVPKFESEFGIKLAIDTQPYDALQQKVFSEFASSSDYYDIVVVDTPWAPALVGSLEPLSGYLNNPELNTKSDPDLSDFVPKVLYDTAVYDAGDPLKQFSSTDEPADVSAITSAGFDVYGMPIQANVAIMGYRADLFNDETQKATFLKEYGRELTVPETWDDYAEVAAFFTQPENNLYGTTVMAGVGDWRQMISRHCSRAMAETVTSLPTTCPSPSTHLKASKRCSTTRI